MADDCRLDLANRRIAELEAELKSLAIADSAFDAKLKALSAHETCACSYDKPEDVCMHHSPRVMALESELAKAREITGKLSRAWAQFDIRDNSTLGPMIDIVSKAEKWMEGK